MDGNHPKNKDPRPKRAKDKDNPYTIFTVGLNTEHPRYYLEFTDGQHKYHSLEISWEVVAFLSWRTSGTLSKLFKYASVLLYLNPNRCFSATNADSSGARSLSKTAVLGGDCIIFTLH